MLELQQLAGHLNFACKVVAPGWAFIQCLCDAIAGLHRPHHRTRVTRGMRDGLFMWQQFLNSYNGSLAGGTISLLKPSTRLCQMPLDIEWHH